MAKQRNEDESFRVDTLKDRLALGELILVPMATAAAVAITFATQAPNEALPEIFSSGLVLWPT